MKTPKSLIDKWLEMRNEEGDPPMTDWLIARLPRLRDELINMRNAMAYKDIKLTRAKIGKNLAECHLALYSIQRRYGFMDPEYEEICDVIFGEEGAPDEKVKRVESVVERRESSEVLQSEEGDAEVADNREKSPVGGASVSSPNGDDFDGRSEGSDKGEEEIDYDELEF